MANTFSIKQFNETAIGDYFRAYLFTVDITYPSNPIGFKCEWVSATSTPVMTTTVQNVDYLHTHVKRAGRTTPSQWQVSIRDDASGNAFTFFNNWRNSIYPQITTTTPKGYKGNATLIMKSPSFNMNKSYEISGVWPMDIGAVQLDYDSEGISIFPVTLSIDFFNAKLIPESIASITNIAETISSFTRFLL